jgi:hypothetical protein
VMAQLDPDFAAPSEWAALYREHGLQVVPAYMPRPDNPAFSWKRPVMGWGVFQDNLVPQETFDGWYGPNGRFKGHQNMGVITGAASDNIFVIDLDTHSNPQAALWWQTQLEVLGWNITPWETWTQTTGGGGVQLFFRAPRGHRIPTNRTPLGVDIRGQGGFAMLPGSLHSSGQCYRWQDGLAPRQCDIAKAPQALLDAIDRLVMQYGGDQPQTGGEDYEKPPRPATDHDWLGHRIDGRETGMRDEVWHGIMEWCRQTSGFPPDEAKFFDAAWSRYERGTRPQRSHPGMNNAEALEAEYRGISLFKAKWLNTRRRHPLDQLIEKANTPNPKAKEKSSSFLEVIKPELESPSNSDVFEFLDVAQIKAMKDPEWLINGLAVENALGFIFGAPGGGKTFVALSQALSLAVGIEDWFGRSIQRTGPVIYISSEGQADLKFRIAAWEAQNQVLADPAPFYLIRQTINFMAGEDVAKLLATVEAIKERVGNPVAVYVDTVSRVLPGADENLQKDMTLFIAACDAIRQRYGATVIGVHHTSRNGNLRGSTVFDGAGDFLLEVAREEGAETGELVARKIKAAQDGWREPFRLEKVALPFGKDSLVAIPCEPQEEPDPANAWPDKPTCRRILQAIQQAWNDGDPWSAAPQAKRRYAPKLIKSTFDIPAKLAEHMIETWITNRVLKYHSYNTHTKLRGLEVVGSID